MITIVVAFVVGCFTPTVVQRFRKRRQRKRAITSSANAMAAEIADGAADFFAEVKEAKPQKAKK